MRVTDENSPHYGKIVVGDDGLPLISTEKSKVGNQSPDWMMVGPIISLIKVLT